MTPIPLPQWADRNGIPGRTAYNWAKNGKLNVPLHRTPRRPMPPPVEP